MNVSLGLDLGTSKLCVIAINCDNTEELACVSRVNDSDISGLPSSWHEQDPQRQLELVLEMLTEISGKVNSLGGKIKALGISGQMHGVLLADRNFNPQTNLITWRDLRVQEDDFKNKYNTAAAKLENITALGCRLSSGFGGASLMWLAENGKIAEGDRAFSLAGWIAAKLTGRSLSEPTHAASWGLYDLEKKDWSEEALSVTGLDKNIMPELVGNNEIHGTLCEAIARQTGLPADLSIAVPLGDNQASVAGATQMDSKSCVLNLGTGGQISIPHTGNLFAAGMETRPYLNGQCLLTGSSLCGGWSYVWLNRFVCELVKEITGTAPDEKHVYDTLDRLSMEVPDADGIKVEPYFLGSRNNPDRRGAISNISADNFTPGTLAAGVIRGMIEELRELSSNADLENIKEIVASGNAARRIPLIKQAVQEIFQLSCRLADVREEAAVGAAIYAAKLS